MRRQGFVGPAMLPIRSWSTAPSTSPAQLEEEFRIPDSGEAGAELRAGGRVVAGARTVRALVAPAAVAIAASLSWREQPQARSPHDAPPSVTWDTVVEVAVGGAVVGPWRMNASIWRYVDDPTVAIDREGFVGVAWADQSRKDVFFQLYNRRGEAQLRQPVNVSRSPGTFSWLPRLAIGSGAPRRVYLLWQEIVFSGGSHGGEIFFARSTDAGRSFSNPVNLSNTPAGDGKGRLTPDLWHNGSLDLALGPDGTLYAAWTEYEGALWFSRSTDGGESFSAALRIADGRQADPARGPSLAAGTAGRVYLVWTVGDDPEADIRFASSSDGGWSFDRPRVLFASRGHADAPKIAVGGDGIIHVAYAESPAGPLGRYHIRYARSAYGGRTFEAPREISGPGQGFESASFPALSVDGRGNLYVIWELFPERRGRPRGLGFTFSGDGGRTFSSPSIVPGTGDPRLGFNGSLQGLLMRKLAVNEAGAIAVVNSTFRPNDASRIRLVLGRSAGR